MRRAGLLLAAALCWGCVKRLYSGPGRPNSEVAVVTLPMDPEVALDGNWVDQTHRFEVLPGPHEVRICQQGQFTGESKRAFVELVGPGQGLTEPRICCWIRFEARSGQRYTVHKAFTKKPYWSEDGASAKFNRFVLSGAVMVQNEVLAQCRR